MMKCIEERCEGVECKEDEVADFIDKKRGCNLSPHLFNIFIGDIVHYISQDKPHTLVIGTTTIPGGIRRNVSPPSSG
jgi:hypothetical protein